MGQEIAASHFSTQDFELFTRRLRDEMALLRDWFDSGRFSATGNRVGFELEAWLVDAEGEPACINAPYLQRLDNPLVVPELATFNVEINSTPQALAGDAFTRMEQELDATWIDCGRVAEELGARTVMIGILPTVRPEHLKLDNMSHLQRYRALNEQILVQRHGRPIELHIKGRDQLHMRHTDVMLESAATSFQIHLKVAPAEALRIYNASKVISAAMVAVAANSPFLFGRELWNETRIPLFEQSVAVGGSDLNKRVSFGIRYLHRSILECFSANIARYPVLLPQAFDEPAERLAHLRLHNGTIWRWNRPLIGFDDSGQPHLRIEHRVVPAGPSVLDAIANAAFYCGSVRALADAPDPPERHLGFEQARSNFYLAARHGLDAEIQWLDRQRITLSELVTHRLLPLARSGLERLGIDRGEIAQWLGIIESRVRTGQTGAAWQRAWVERHAGDMQELVAAYLERQASGLPVHEWSL